MGMSKSDERKLTSIWDQQHRECVHEGESVCVFVVHACGE